MAQSLRTFIFFALFLINKFLFLSRKEKGLSLGHIQHTIKKGSPMHKSPTQWGSGRVDVHSLTPTSGEIVSRI